MDLVLFFGRFHPLVVHLPIGLLTLAYLIFFFSRRPSFEYLEKALGFVLLLSTISAVASISLGWLIAEQGYEAETLFRHRWLGVSVAVGSLSLWLAQTRTVTLSRRGFAVGFHTTMVLLVFTGHLGGNLTHGEGYLFEYAPNIVKNTFGPVQKESIQPIHPDSSTVYDHLISPILLGKCGSCHDSEQMKGGLDITSIEGLTAGGNDGSVINQSAESSELFLRVTLAPDHKKFMPTRGTPLSFTEINLLKWWIDNGASFDSKLSSLQKSGGLATMIQNDFGLDVKRKPIYEVLEISDIPDEMNEELKELGFSVKKIYDGNNFLDVSLVGLEVGAEIPEISLLENIGNQITWLDLSGYEIDNSALNVIGEMEHLTKLKLHSTKITDDGIDQLLSLKYLESLNIYNTEITDKGLKKLETMEKLKSVYVWQTAVTAEGISDLKMSLPQIEVIDGI